jgi:hypothetical protein
MATKEQVADASQRLHFITHNGLCKGREDLDFYAERIGQDVIDTCAKCLIRTECADYALMYELHGFWGGLFARGRDRERKIREIRLIDVYVRQTHAGE